MDSYEKAMGKSIQNQFDRVAKQKMMGANYDDLKDVQAQNPAMPKATDNVICQFCGNQILQNEPGIDPRVKQKELKFRVCRNCSVNITGHGGLLDRSTPHLKQERKF